MSLSLIYKVNMKTTAKIIISIFAVALIGTALYSYKNKVVLAPAQNVPQKPAEEKESLSTDSLEVNVTYPVIPGTSEKTKEANVFLHDEIKKQINSFEKDAIESSANSRIELPANIRSTVTGSPATEEKNDRYIAIFMGMEWYLRGAAHPWHTIDTYVYDYKQDRFVSADDMFKSDTDYLKRLSEYSYQDLLAQSETGDNGFIFDESIVTEGTKPTKENFSHILPIKDGLVIYFDEYQVAPYAAGSQQVVIPYTKLKDIINPDGILGMYIK